MGTYKSPLQVKKFHKRTAVKLASASRTLERISTFLKRGQSKESVTEPGGVSPV